MNRGKNPVKAITNDVVLFHAAFVGAATADMTLATNAQYPLTANLGLTAVRTSIGLYVVTLTDITPQILDSRVTIIGTTAALSGKVKVAFSPTTKIGQITIQDIDGALADPQTADTVIVCFAGRDSTA